MILSVIFSGIAKLAWLCILAYLGIGIIMFVCSITGFDSIFVQGASVDLLQATLFTGFVWLTSTALSYILNPHFS